MALYLSKSDFMNYLKHPALLWLSKRQKDSLPPISETLQSIFNTGNEVDALARQRYPSGVLIEGYGEEAQQATLQVVESQAPVIFQAHFQADDRTMCKTDILQRVSDTAFDLHEVKMTASVKPEHYPDLAFQKRVLERCGIVVRRCYVTCIDTSYVREGEIEPEKLFKKTEVTEEVAKVGNEVEKQIGQALEVLDRDECPNQSPRFGGTYRFSDWMGVYFHLHPELSPRSVFTLRNLTAETAAMLEDHGYETIDEIADAALMELSSAQRAHAEASRSEPHVNKQAIQKFLDELQFPLYFLDYETISHAMPLFDGTRPYQAVPFQYSLHRLSERGGELTHFEFLARDQNLPVAAMAEQLQQDLEPFGSVIVYTQYEQTQNDNMARMAPQYRQFFDSLNDRLVDLWEPFSKGHYRHPDFGGSNSLKAILPALIHDLSYKGLSIQEGDTAQHRWRKAVFGEKTLKEREAVFADLLEYCKTDTLATVRVYGRLCKDCA